MFKKILQTQDDFMLTLARVGLGIVMFPHGAQKVLGWFGGYGFTGTMGFMTSMGIPWILALLALVAEFAGSLGLITGLLSRIAAFGIAMVMLVAVFTIHGHNGFFMDWSGIQKAEGFEYHILVLTLAIIVMVRGSGAYSLDKKLSAHCKNC